MTKQINQELVIKIVKEVFRQLGQPVILTEQKTNEENIDYLSIGMMGRLAQCSPKDDIEELILSRFISGQEVTVKATKVEFLQLSTKPSVFLAQQLAEQLRQLKSFGLQVVDEQQPECIMKPQKTLYTLEKMKALKLMQGEMLKTNEQDIFTPLAQDYIRSKKIRLDIRRGSK